MIKSTHNDELNPKNFSLVVSTYVTVFFLSKLNHFCALFKQGSDRFSCVQLSATNRHNSNGNNNKIKQSLVCVIYLDGLDYRILFDCMPCSVSLFGVLFFRFFIFFFLQMHNTFNFTANCTIYLYLSMCVWCNLCIICFNFVRRFFWYENIIEIG